jgi:hypothetical protein
LTGCPDDKKTTLPVHDASVEAEAAPSTEPCDTGYLGDPSQPAQIELRALKADGTDVALNDGDDLAVLFPPQGGRVAFVGVRMTNIDGCSLQIIGALRDPDTKQVRLDGRTVNLVRQPDGWGVSGQGVTGDISAQPGIGDYSNVPLCPNQWADRNIYDQPFELDVEVTDRQKKTASKTITVTPRCAEPGERETACRCLCMKGYVLGQACGEDAGIDAGNP